MRLLLIAPYYDRQTPGESWSTYKWVQGLSRSCDVTVLTTHEKGWDVSQSPTEATTVMNWLEPRLPAAWERFESELKPSYVSFYFRARRWIKQAVLRGERFDLVHQISPLALRYPCPARGLGLRYLIGPLAGSLPTPPGFVSARADRGWYRQLRKLDHWRLRHDPVLRRSYAEAEVVLGVAPYVGDYLKQAGVSRFRLMRETSVDTVAPAAKEPPTPGSPLRLLFVGRLIPTKGVLESIHAVAGAAAAGCAVTLDVVGAGVLEKACRSAIREHKVQSLVTLHGRIAREQVFEHYHRAHVFLFPSYREPSGNVVMEALGAGLPVITTTEGGPGHTVDDRAGIKVRPVDRTQLIAELKHAIIGLCHQPERIRLMSSAALELAHRTGRWETAIDSTLSLYRELLA